MKLPVRANKVEEVTAPLPYLCQGAAYEGFVSLRKLTHESTGHDFLAVCGDMLRPDDYRSSKPGVANRSWHKTGRAFDYNQEDKRYVLVPEPQTGRIYFRTYILCEAGMPGINLFALNTKIWQAGYLVPVPKGNYFDFTNAARNFDYKRIPAWKSWQMGKPYSTTMEFWHYQCDEGMHWQDAMECLRNNEPAKHKDRILGRNDRGDEVSFIQLQLMKLGFLPSSEIDGVFGQNTHTAVQEFQRKHGLSADGLVGPETRKVLDKESAG